MSIVIDIKTRVFDDDDVAYRLFPGQGYRHFKAMKEHSVVFLDNPGIPLPGKNGYNKDEGTLREIAKSEGKQPLINADGDNLVAELQRVDEMDFANARWGAKRELNRGWMNALYHKAKIGDLVVVPSPGIIKNDEGEWQKAYTLVGEIVGNPERWERNGPPNLIAGRYIVRRVKWLAQVDEAELDPQVAIGLRTQNALTAMRARAFERVLGAAYKNIILGEEFLARFITTDAEFTAFESYHFNAFVMAVVAACRRAENGQGPFGDGVSIYDIAAEVLGQDDLVPDQESSIHSPGYMTLRGSVLVPAVMSALFALAVAAHADPALDPFGGTGTDQIVVVNSESEAFNPCDVGIDQAVKDALNIMGYPRWQQLCAAGAKANDNDGLQSITTVETRPDPEEL
ncbi:hypothetical protein [Phaeovulum sp. W22_SRMD_FR3]|uniref:hypothetical protein n=1 Tax=Phaeovulum sp. W22_SRMD_FR3 TaxID=3240274 RepID=UPI003F98EC62